MFKCPHCNGEFEVDGKTGALICKVCKCVFRICLVRHDSRCYAKLHKKEIKELVREQKNKRKRKKHVRHIKDEDKEEV